MTTPDRAIADLNARLVEQRLNPWGKPPAREWVLEAPEPVVKLNLWPLFPYAAGIACWVAIFFIAGW